MATTATVPNKIYQSVDSPNIYDVMPDLNVTAANDYVKSKYKEVTPDQYGSIPQQYQNLVQKVSQPSGYFSGPQTADNQKGFYSTDPALPQAGANDPNMKNIGTAGASAYVPIGSAADKVSTGIANGTVSATNPQQQFNAASTGNNVNAPGINVNPVNSGAITNNLNQAFNATKTSGAPPPQTAGEAATAVDTASKTAAASSPGPTSTPNVDNFFNPATNPTLSDTIKQVNDYLNPVNTTKQLTDQLTKITTDQGVVSNLNTQLMNLKTVMAGSENDLRNEVTKANGFATESQIQALTVARNKTLLQQSAQIENLLTTAQNQVANDTTLFQNEKDMANTQFSQRMGIVQFAQQLQDQQQTAARSTADTIIKSVGFSGFVNSLLNSDPTGQSVFRNEQLLGLQPGQLSQLATQEKTATNLATIQAAGTTSPYVVNANGEVWNSQTGYAYTSAQDFALKTGMTLQQAAAQIKPLNLPLDQQMKIAETTKAQVDAQYAPALNQADLAQKNASAASSAASAAKTRSETGVAGPNQPGFDAQGKKYTVQSGQQEIMDYWKSIKAWGPDGKVNPKTYNDALASWVQEGLSAADFKAEFGGYINQKHVKDYN